MEHLDKDDTQSGTVETDLYCVTCEYNLRTLSTAGRCPECGTLVSVTRSLLSGRLAAIRASPVTPRLLIAVMFLAFPFAWAALHFFFPMIALAALAEWMCCAGWLVLGPRHFRGRRRILASIIRYTCAALCVLLGAVLAGALYFVLYEFPNA